MAWALAVASIALSFQAADAQEPNAPRPHIVVVLLDDMGYSDLGCYGAPIIETPTIDRLADEGLRFSQFYNTAKCAQTRASLLTGLYPHQAGFRGLEHGVTLAEVLREAGYFTTMAGKWHLGSQPTDRGFHRYFGHLNGAVDFFSGLWKGNDNAGRPENHWQLNGEPFEDFGDDFYTTRAITDYAIRFIDDALEQDRPFLSYIAYNAPHYPLQAPREAVMKYRGRFREIGWDELRRQRYANQLDSGLIRNDWELSPRPDYIPAWDELSADQQDWEDFRMAVYAAMIDRVDRNLNRLIDHLKERGEWENTLLLLMSDNGGCAIERTDDRQAKPWQPGSFWTLDPGWANVNNTPFRWYKQHQHEGGIATPLVVHWPAGLGTEPGSITHEPSHLIDLMPTAIDLAGAEYPDRYDNRAIRPLQGRSLRPILQGEERKGHDWLHFNFAGRNRAIRVGDWKLVSAEGARWELYNLRRDRTELHDRSGSHPALADTLQTFWHMVAVQIADLPERHRRPVSDRQPTIRSQWITDRPNISP